ncbi:hypothetical protein SKAU_G00251240 [Synaphobranchus kaupii]|uniref:Uncharacterized protein n=1 Tax=Synaphobranchus kaupii TaxID=118154 RepID=A0A9Q1F2W0_SYNKA|nr:hypothetical protein SKAU_G00251240 [Synaphobranchus kaupii]
MAIYSGIPASKHAEKDTGRRLATARHDRNNPELCRASGPTLHICNAARPAVRLSLPSPPKAASATPVFPSRPDSSASQRTERMHGFSGTGAFSGEQRFFTALRKPFLSVPFECLLTPGNLRNDSL